MIINKNKIKCNSLCRCRNCINSQDGNENNSLLYISKNYESCLSKSIFILNNKIIVENINKNKKIIPIKRKI